MKARTKELVEALQFDGTRKSAEAIAAHRPDFLSCCVPYDKPPQLTIQWRGETLSVLPGGWVVFVANSIEGLTMEEFQAKYEMIDSPDLQGSSWGDLDVATVERIGPQFVTTDSLNKEIVSILRIGGMEEQDFVHLYAAARIEELEKALSDGTKPAKQEDGSKLGAAYTRVRRMEDDAEGDRARKAAIVKAQQILLDILNSDVGASALTERIDAAAVELRKAYLFARSTT